MSELSNADGFQDQPDRRREHRWEPRGGVEVVCKVGDSGQGPDVALALLDVSASGARLLVRDAPALGEAVEVCLYTTSGPGWFRQAARVVWSVAARGGHYFAGVRFEAALASEEAEALRQLCRPEASSVARQEATGQP